MELKKEGLSNLGDLSYKDNQPVLDLFLTKPIGLMSLLDEQCRGLNVSLGRDPRQDETGRVVLRAVSNFKILSVTAAIVMSPITWCYIGLP